MKWFVLALAAGAFAQVIAFAIAWLVVRKLRQLRISRIAAAFVLAWLALPLALALGVPIGALVIPALALNGAFLFALGNKLPAPAVPLP